MVDKMKKLKYLIAILATGTVLVGCGSSSNGSSTEAATFTVTCRDTDSDGNDDTCTVQGTINQDYTFEAAFVYELVGGVKVGSGNESLADADAVQAAKDAGVTLTIEAGTDIRGLNNSSFLLVTRGNTIVANGTAASPITFSSVDADFDGSAEWGGVIIQGFAPQYGKGGTGACFGTGTICNVTGEGGPEIGNFGGNEPADNSGTLRYVRIAEGGLSVGTSNEINGLTLQGVGHATTIEFIQVHGNLDDGIEWFGGTVNVKYAVLTNNDDDDLDFDEGFQGNMQFVIIKKSDNAAPQGSNDPRGIEANSSDDEFVSETQAAIANVLIVGGDVNNAAGSEQPAMRLRGDVTVDIFNTAMRNYTDECIRIDDAVTGTAASTLDTNVDLVNILGSDCTDNSAAPLLGHENADSATNVTLAGSSLTIDAAYAITDAAADNVSGTLTAFDNGSGFAFDQTDYIGAVEPGTAAADAWWNGWIIPGSL